jgi:hypothetical protein
LRSRADRGFSGLFSETNEQPETLVIIAASAAAHTILRASLGHADPDLPAGKVAVGDDLLLFGCPGLLYSGVAKMIHNYLILNG